VLAKPIARSLDLDDDGVVKQPIEQRGGDDGIAKNLAPFGKAAVGGQDHGTALIAGIDRLEEQIAAAGNDRQISDLVDNQERGSAQETDTLTQLSFPFSLCQDADDIGQAGKVDAAARFHSFDTQCRCEMALASSRRSQEGVQLVAIARRGDRVTVNGEGGSEMKLPRRNFLHLATGAAVLPDVSRFAWAQAYPSRPVCIIVGFPAGGNLDMIARLMGQWLSERLGQPFVIENRPGAGTNIATETVVRAPAHGYTLLMVGPTQAINTTLHEKLNFNFIRDIAPVAGIISTANVMLMNPSVPAKTVPEFIAYAKANPRKVNMASGGTGGACRCR
jgi:hypothetical protein